MPKNNKPKNSSSPPLSGLTFDPNDLSHLADRMTSQDDIPPTSRPDSQVNILSLLGNFRKLLLETSNPIDPAIIKSMEVLIPHLTTKRLDLIDRYTALVSRTGPEFPSIKEDIIQASKAGVDSLYWAIKAALTAYQVAASKTASHAISDISNAAMTLVAMLQQSHTQHEAFQESIEHMSVTWNSLTGSMTEYMSRMDQVLLKQTEPRHRDTQTVITPSVDSHAASQRQKATQTTFVPGGVYKSMYGVLSIDEHGSIAFKSNHPEGRHLAKVITSGMKLAALNTILNKDLIAMTEYMIMNPKSFDKYREMTVAEKRDLINKLTRSATDKSNQWTLIVPDDD